MVIFITLTLVMIKFTDKKKLQIKKAILNSLKQEKEINKIFIFGSFLESETPNDIDIAIYQDSQEPYLNLAMKYRRLTRAIARTIPVEIIPIKSNASDNSFLSEIEAGELIYEK